MVTETVVERIERIIREELSRQARNDDILLYDDAAGMVDGVFDVQGLARALRQALLAECWFDGTSDVVDRPCHDDQRVNILVSASVERTYVSTKASSLSPLPPYRPGGRAMRRRSALFTS
jgi:hypothetical protein